MKVAGVVASAGPSGIVLLVVGLVGLGGLAGACAGAGPHAAAAPPPEASPGPSAPEAPPTPPDPSSQAGIVCGGHEQLRLEGKVLDAPGVAIDASGGCQVTIVHGRLSGGTIGIRATDQARVTVEDSHVKGGEHALVVGGHAVVECRNSEWIGPIQAEDHGRIVDRGRNVWTR